VWSASALLGGVLRRGGDKSISVGLSCHISQLRTSNLSLSVESAAEVGNSFTHACPDWKEGTYELFKNWAANQLGEPRSEDEVEEEIPVEYKKAKDISFNRNESGGLILPPLSQYRRVRQKQRVVRAYVGAVYSKSIHPIFLMHLLRDMTGDFTGSSTSAFPYSLSAKSDQTIFSPECVPEGFRLSDPDHLTTAQIHVLYSHWLERQEDGLAPLIILNASPLHGAFMRKSEKRKGKAKMEYFDVGDDDEEDEEKDATMKEPGDDNDDDDDDDDDDDGDEGKQDAEMDGGIKEGEEEENPVMKYGPPLGKQKANPSSAQNTTHAGVAGPSTTPRLKYASKASNPGEASKLPSTFQAQVASVKPTTSKKTNLSKREAEQDLIKDGPAKRVKTNGSKKVERQAKGQGDHPPPAVYASELPKSSKHSKSSKLSEASKPSKPDDKKRNPAEERELGAESSGQTKGLEKTDSAINAPQPMPTTPKSVN